MGSEINSKKWDGIRDHSAGIWDHKPWDRDQHYCKRIRNPVSWRNNKDHKILKCALIGGLTCQHFSFQLYFCCNISIRYKTVLMQSDLLDYLQVCKTWRYFSWIWRYLSYVTFFSTLLTLCLLTCWLSLLDVVGAKMTELKNWSKSLLAEYGF